jgi:putative spermidine/putrescine transport system ATP-binding protein
MALRKSEVGGESIVVFDDISKSYDGENLVVAGLHLDVERGEFLTMLGPSGSGKTTVLMMLAGFEVPTAGRIMIDGVDSTKIPAHKRDLGFVFQNYALFPHMSVNENLAFPLKVRRMGRGEIEERVRETLEMVRLGDFGDRLPGQLSGGQQQRVALARALVFCPKLVLMDEPLGALDKNLREEMQYEIKHIHENMGVTMVYVTHDQTEALVMSDRVAVFYDGLIQQVASPEEIYDKPSSAFVASFIGENNCVYGEVTRIEGERCCVLCGEDKIWASKTPHVSEGSRTMVSLRPELVGLTALEGEGVNEVEGCVEELIFLGSHTRVRLNVLGSDGFIMQLVHGTMESCPGVGDRVKMYWRWGDGWALDVPLESS